MISDSRWETQGTNTADSGDNRPKRHWALVIYFLFVHEIQI